MLGKLTFTSYLSIPGCVWTMTSTCKRLQWTDRKERGQLLPPPILATPTFHHTAQPYSLACSHNSNFPCPLWPEGVASSGKFHPLGLTEATLSGFMLSLNFLQLAHLGGPPVFGCNPALYMERCLIYLRYECCSFQSLASTRASVNHHISSVFSNVPFNLKRRTQVRI